MTRLAPAVAIAAILAAPAMAQDNSEEFSAGRAEYMASCAACHGANADGNGELATMLNVRVPDLTGISARNDGVFPFVNVFQIIDGRAQIKAHGDPMPLFGARYKRELGDTMGPFGSEVEVRARVLELALYLQSIQASQ